MGNCLLLPFQWPAYVSERDLRRSRLKFYHSSEKIQKNEAARVVRNKRKKLDIKVEDEEYPSDQSVDNFHHSDSVTKRRDRKRERKLRPQEGHKNEPFSFS